MSEHRFTVIVSVDGWDAGDRDETAYAFAALNCAGLPDVSQLDGFADLGAQADIISVTAEHGDYGTERNIE